MATKNYREDIRRRTPIDPKTIRKGGFTNAETTKMHGNKETTATGYKTGVHLGKKFDSYCEVVLEGAATPLAFHPKKTRTIRVINGAGYLSKVTDPKGEAVTDSVTLVPGDIIECEPGIAYRISTSSTLVEVVITQDLNYEKDLVTLEPAIGNGAEVPYVQDVERADIIRELVPRSAIRTSKAVEQIIQQRAVIDDRRNNPSKEKLVNKDPRSELAEILSQDSNY